MTGGKEADCQFQEGSQLRKDAGLGGPYMCQTLSEKTDTWIVVIKYMVACLSIPRSYAFKYEDAKGVHAQCFFGKVVLELI